MDRPTWIRTRPDHLHGSGERAKHERDRECGNLVLAGKSSPEAEDGDDRDAEGVALPRQLSPLEREPLVLGQNACTTASTSAPRDSRAKQVAIRSGMREGGSESPRANADSFARQRL